MSCLGSGQEGAPHAPPLPRVLALAGGPVGLTSWVRVKREGVSKALHTDLAI